MQNLISIALLAALFTGAASLSATPVSAGSCCGGSSGTTLSVPKYARALADISFEYEKYDGFWNRTGSYTPDPPGSDLRQYRMTLGGGYRFSQSWQAGLSIPYVWNSNKYSGLSSRSSGIGDAAMNVWFEALDETTPWKIMGLKDLRPSVMIGAALLIPTGISPYDDIKSSFDVTGRGFYRVDGNVLVSKTIHPFSASLSLSYGAYLERPINREYGTYIEPYHKKLGDRFSASASLGYIYFIGNGGDTLTGSVSFSHINEADASINGSRDAGTGFRKNSAGGSVVYSGTDHDWSGRISWNHSLKSDGWGENFPATDIFTMGVSYAIR